MYNNKKILKIVKLESILVMLFVITITSTSIASENGFHFGNSKLNLGLLINQSYDSNVYCGNTPLGDLVLHILPSINFVLSTNKVDFNIGGTLDVVRYFGIMNGTINGTPYNTKELSTILGDSTTILTYRPSDKYVLKLRNDFFRTSDPRNDVFGTFARIDNTSGIGFEYNPSDSAFKFSLDYLFNFDFYDQGTGLSDADYYSHRPSFLLKWYFFPKTSLLFDIDANIVRYPNQWNYTDQVPGYFTSLNLVNFKIGISGVFSPKLSLIFMIGYGNAFMQQNATPDPTINQQENDQTVLADITVEYKMNENMRIRAGYNRGINPASFFAYFNGNRFFASYSQTFFKRLKIEIQPSIDLQYYGRPIFSGTDISSTRSDVYGTFDVHVKYDILKWLSIGLANSFSIRSTNFKDATGNQSFNKNVTAILVDLHY